MQLLVTYTLGALLTPAHAVKSCIRHATPTRHLACTLHAMPSTPRLDIFEPGPFPLVQRPHAYPFQNVQERHSADRLTGGVGSRTRFRAGTPTAVPLTAAPVDAACCGAGGRGRGGRGGWAPRGSVAKDLGIL